jgi:two-component system NarL family sensor kinase
VSGWLSFGAGMFLLGALVLALTAARRRIWPDGAVPAALLGTLGAAAVVGLLATGLWLAGSPAAVTDRLWVAAVAVLLPVAIVLYPDGRVPAGLGWAAVALVAATGGLGVAYFDPYASSGLTELVAYLLLLAIHWWRFEHSDSATRRALQWLALGALPGPLLAIAASFILTPPVGAALYLIVWAVLLLCLVVGLVAPEIRDIRHLTLSVSAHTITVLTVMSVFAGVLAGLDTIAGRRVTLAPGALGLIAAACALGYAPFAGLFRQIIEVLLFGVRHDPIRAASRAGDQLGEDPVPALRSLRESLALPYAALVDGSGLLVAATGTATGVVVHRPLSATDPGLGRLEVGLRAGQSHLLPGDQQVLAVLAPALGQLMHARRLGTDLQASRAAMVEGIEEERRRLRRDLHDGVGPTLAGVALGLDLVAARLADDPAAARAMLAELKGETAAAVDDVRRLVHGLRPPALDELGLVRALRQQTDRLALRSPGLDIRVDSDLVLPPLSAATEVAAYRIAVEAVTNSVRHAGATSCHVQVAADGALRLEVVDDGSGITDGTPPGVGLAAMRERAAEVGGSCIVAPADGHGTRVLAVLPLEGP